MPSLHLPPEPALMALPVTQLPRPTDPAQSHQTSLDVPCVPQCPTSSVSRLSLAFTLESPGGRDQACLAHGSTLVHSTWHIATSWMQGLASGALRASAPFLLSHPLPGPLIYPHFLQYILGGI